MVVKVCKSISLLVVVVALGCMSSYGAPDGSVYSDVIMHKEITTPGRIGTRQGIACATGYLGMIAGGDASLKAAAALGGIAEIRAVDFQIKRTLGSVVVQTCTIAHGD